MRAPPEPSSRRSCVTLRVSWSLTASIEIDAKKDIKLNLIEAGNRVLPAFPPHLSEAIKLLTDLGVHVHTSARVTEVTANGVKLASGDFIAAELVVWSAGVKGPDCVRNLEGLETNRASQLVVCRRCRPRATRTSLPLATAPRARGSVEMAKPCRPVRRPRTSRLRIWHDK